MRFRPLFFPGLCLTIILVGTLRGQAQVNGRLKGSVTDADGTALSGVSVRITNKATNSTVKATTNGAGQFNAPVAPGNYQITASRPGFGEVKTDVTVHATEGDIIPIVFPEHPHPPPPPPPPPAQPPHLP